jgi:uncharacterized membrane protein YdjX (TVP38/TMEM64 family)
MKKYWTFIGLLLLLFLILFLIVEQLNVPILTAPHYLIQARSVSAASVGITLLIADVFLPVPSSLVMITNGAVFGVVLGTLLSLVGSLGAGLLGFFLGRWGGFLLARLVPPEERLQAERLLEKWGNLAIIVTRPVPLLAETTAIVAGTSTMGWKNMALATILGSLPAAFLYAFTGATAANFDNVWLTFGGALLMAGLFWALSDRLHKTITDKLKASLKRRI